MQDATEAAMLIAAIFRYFAAYARMPRARRCIWLISDAAFRYTLMPRRHCAAI